MIGGRVVQASPIASDAELVRFIADRVGSMTQTALLAEIAHHFPAGQVPSRSALNRYLTATYDAEHRASEGQRVSRGGH